MPTIFTTTRRAATAAALATAIGVLAGAPAAYADTLQAATASGAMVAQGASDWGHQGVGEQFYAYFVVPSGVVAGTGPLDSTSVDLRKPVVNFTALGGTRSCTTTANPTSYSAGVPVSPPGAVDGIWFDVACDDGSGYDFYRVTMSNPLFDTNAFVALNNPASVWGMAGGNGTDYLVSGHNTADEWSGFQVCGHNAAGFTCIPPSSGAESTTWVHFLSGATLAEEATAGTEAQVNQVLAEAFPPGSPQQQAVHTVSNVINSGG